MLASKSTLTKWPEQSKPEDIEPEDVAPEDVNGLSFVEYSDSEVAANEGDFLLFVPQSIDNH